MAHHTVEDFLAWFERDMSHFAPLDTYSIRTCSADSERGTTEARAIIYTETNEYTIRANAENSDRGYLGCSAMSRKPRAGENWNRGRDLADGSLSPETWHAILADIVSFELVRIHRADDQKAIRKEV